MSDCNYSESLSDYLDGHLDADREQAVRRHLQGSTCHCPRELEELRSLAASLRDLPPGAVPAGGWERLETALEVPGASRRARRSVLAWAFQQLGADLPSVPPPSSGAARQEFGRASALRDPEVRPRVLAAVNREQLPPLRFRDEDLVSYGAELASLDSLIEVARSLPAATAEPEFRKHLDQLTSLREDLLTEMVLQAQAERTATWQ